MVNKSYPDCSAGNAPTSFLVGGGEVLYFFSFILYYTVVDKVRNIGGEIQHIQASQAPGTVVTGPYSSLLCTPLRERCGSLYVPAAGDETMTPLTASHLYFCSCWNGKTQVTQAGAA